MKRKNFLTNILNIIVLIGLAVWLVCFEESKLIIIARISNLGIIIDYLIVISIISVAIINLVVGIRNRKNSKAKLVLYIINFVLWILLPILYMMRMETLEDIYMVLGIIDYAIILILTIILFILNRKTKRAEKQIKYDIIIFSIISIITVFSILIPGIYISQVKNKFEEHSVSEEQVDTEDYIAVEDKTNGKYDYLDKNGEIKFSINADTVTGDEYYLATGKGYVKYIVARKGEDYAVIDINNRKDIKIILEYKYDGSALTNEFLDLFDFDKNISASYKFTYQNPEYDESTSLDGLSNGNVYYEKFEENENYQYKYYTNENFTVQMVEKEKELRDLTQIENQEVSNIEYYLIKDDQKIKLDCKSLIFVGETMSTFQNKYIPFIGENANGYFNANGEKFEIPKEYVFLDKNDDTGIVAKIDEDETKKTSSIPQPIKVMMINNDRMVLSQIYEGAISYKDFYILYNYDYEKEKCIEFSVWNKQGKELVKDVNCVGGFGNVVFVTDDSNQIMDVYSKNGKVNKKSYTYNKYNISRDKSILTTDRILGSSYDLYWIYQDILSNM